MTQQPHGTINQVGGSRKTDYLYRVSIKGLIKNSDGEVLVVKETGRPWWDLPGGGMDHDEDIKSALAREMYEEVGLMGDFEYKVIAVDDPKFLAHINLWQMRIIFEVTPEIFPSEPGSDADEIQYINPAALKDSDHSPEISVYKYASLLE